MGDSLPFIASTKIVESLISAKPFREEKNKKNINIKNLTKNILLYVK